MFTKQENMRFLSLGAGVQSSVMLMMALRGEIERPDHVIFSDVGWESLHIYLHVDWLQQQCEKNGVPFHRVSAGNIREDMVQSRNAGSGEYAGRWASMPLFVDTGKGVEGRIRRQCTAEYKIAPIVKKQRELMGYKPRQRIPAGAAEVMVGISTDEARRVTPAAEAWIDKVYPLIDPLKMSRADCQKWWSENYPHRRLVKSSCLGCPNTSDRQWLEMKLNRPDEWEDVCQFDDLIRNATGMRGTSYLHRSLRPLREVPLGEGQTNFDLEDALYCSGGCGL